MKYYISKPNSHKLDKSIIDGITSIEPDAQFVDSLQEADICVFQSGWTKSKTCVAEHHLARDMHIERRESYIYTDKFKVKIN